MCREVEGKTYLAPDLRHAVGRQLRHMQLVVAVGHVHGVVGRINQQTAVIVRIGEGRVLGPRALRLLGGKHVGLAGALDQAVPVEQAVAGAVLHGGSPDATDVGAAGAVEVVLGAKVKHGHGVAEVLPVDEVIRAQHGGTGRVVHGGGGVVVGVIDADDVDVSEVLVHDGVGEVCHEGGGGGDCAAG